MKAKLEYTDPKLSTKNPKDWFVYYRYYGKLIKHRFDLNRIKDLKEKKKTGERFALKLLADLDNGYNPTTKTIPKEFIKVRSVLEAVRYIVEVKSPSVRPRTIEGYNWTINLLVEWNEADHIAPEDFNKVHAQKFMDHLILIKKFSGKSHNNVLIFMRSFFTAMIERGIVPGNPFKSVIKKPVMTGKNVAFSDDEMFMMDRAIYSLNFRLWLFKEFIYNAAIRRTELTRLKVRDIQSDTILMSAETSKNKKQENVSINLRLSRVIEMMELDKYGPDDFVFGYRLQTGPQPFANVSHISTSHLKIAQKIGIRSDCTLYAWKHTGAVRLYQKTKDAYLVMRHLRHSSFSITEIYLKSLGVSMDAKINNMEW